MQDIREFIQGFNFDRIDSYRLNRLNTISCTQKFDKFEILDEHGTEIPNGILDAKLNLNQTAEMVSSTKKTETISKLKNLFKTTSENLLNREMPLFKTALLFYENDILVKGINISFRQGIFCSTDHQFLSISESDFESFRLFFYADLKHELYESANYYGATGDNWQNHSFPNSFYFNPRWKSYETSIKTSIICQNYDRVKLEIETNGKNISSWQLRRIFYVMHYPFELRERMNKMILEYYNQMTKDYNLPKLNEELIENLKYFVKLVGVTISENEESDILLSFKNWDEEHGLHFYINELNEKIEFAF